MKNVYVWGSKSVKNATLKYATTMTAHINRVIVINNKNISNILEKMVAEVLGK
jgi:zona occludens toxin (predicted ATPase)